MGRRFMLLLSELCASKEGEMEEKKVNPRFAMDM